MRTYPKVIFKYSSVYDRRCREDWLRKDKKGYPSKRKILNYIKKVEKLWRKKEKEILKEISKITKLKWREKSINCYLVGRVRPFSLPLTMPIFERKANDFIDVLTHELIHNIFTQNQKYLKKSWNFFNRKYKKESQVTRIHILVHAVHSHIYMEFFGEKRLKRNIKRLVFRQDYKRAWDIVQKQGYHNIINEFVKMVK